MEDYVSKFVQSDRRSHYFTTFYVWAFSMIIYKRYARADLSHVNTALFGLLSLVPAHEISKFAIQPYLGNPYVASAMENNCKEGCH